MIISDFKGKHAFLSNFYFSPVEYEGISYLTAEHAFQAAKTLDPIQRRAISSLATPGHAKRYGRRLDLRPFWDEIRIDVMRQILLAKFSNPKLKKMLLDTGDALLIEGNHWGDTFWGVCDGEGKNHLGRLLMKVRKEIA